MTKEAREKFGRTLLLIGRLVLAGIFLYAGYSKLKPPESMGWSLGSIKISLSMFALQVDSYQMLSASAVNAVSHLLPPFEVFLGLWLFSGIALRISSTITTLLLLALFAVLIRSYALHLGINCGCFGTAEQLGPERLVQEAMFVALSLAVTIGAFLVRRRSTALATSEAGTVPAISSEPSLDVTDPSRF